MINQSQASIDVAVYSINNDNIVKALVIAYKRGIKLRILTDRLQASGKNSKVLSMYKAGLNVKVHSVNKIEHNKFAIFDSDKMVTCSCNWTNPASETNSENCLFILQNNQIIDEYQNRFKYLWQINRKYKSEEWFRKRLSRF